MNYIFVAFSLMKEKQKVRQRWKMEKVVIDF